MSDAHLLRFKAVAPKPGYKLSVQWDRGSPMIVDLSAMIGKGGVFADLQDETVFAGVRIGPRNRVIEWRRSAVFRRGVVV